MTAVRFIDLDGKRVCIALWVGARKLFVGTASSEFLPDIGPTLRIAMDVDPSLVIVLHESQWGQALVPGAKYDCDFFVDLTTKPSPNSADSKAMSACSLVN